MVAYNPYLSKKPVSEYKNFMFREDTVKKLFNNTINGEVGENVAIIAELGHGKSSIINALFMGEFQQEFYLKDSSTILVRINFEEYIGQILDFYRIMYDRMKEAVTEHSCMKEEIIKLVVRNGYEFVNPNEVKALIETILKKSNKEGYRTVIVIDNLEKGVKKADFTVEEFSFLRTLGNSFEYNVSYIITATRDLKFISKAAEVSGFDAIFKIADFNPLFSEPQCRKYMRQPFKKADIYLEDEEIDDIIEISGGNPYVLREACSILFDFKSREGEEAVLEKEKLLPLVVSECEAYFRSLVKYSSDKEMEICYKVLNHESCDTLDQEFRSLQDRSIINEDGDDFVCEAFKIFIEKVKDEYYNSNQLAKEEAAAGSISLNDVKLEFQMLKTSLEKSIDSKLELNKINILSELKNLILSGKEEAKEEQVEEFAEKVVKLNPAGNIKELPDSLKNTRAAKVWNELDDKVKEFCVVGENINIQFSGYDMDLSPISICYCKALEYNISKYVLPILKKYFPTLLVDRDQASNLKGLTLGQLRYLLTYNNSAKNHLLNILRMKRVDESKLVSALSVITQIRNDTAHAGKTITLDKIKVLRDYIVGENYSLLEETNKLR